MTIQSVLLPVFVSVGLTFFLLLWTSRRGSPASHQATIRNGAAGPTNWPDAFELLFYILIALALPLRHADLVIVMLSWVFVITRFAHTGLLVTSNETGHRSMAWFAGVLVLFAMWLYFALKILLLI